VHQLGENGSYYSWVIRKTAQNCKQIVLTLKQKLELIEKFENVESVTESAKDYGIGIE
jgi:hypothetical protein